MSDSASILIVDDDPRICDMLSRYLKREGYRVSAAHNAESMRRHMERDFPNLVILDVLLPGEDGLTLAGELRRKSDVGIIMLTGKGETVDRVVGLELGADDYISKPFDERELLARIRSVLRRVAPADASQKLIRGTAKFEGWTLNFDANELLSPQGESVYLTAYEYQLLAAFVRSPNRVFSRDQMLNLITGRDWMPSNRSVDVIIGKLRRKLEDNPRRPRMIKTIRGIGYKFTSPVNLT